jgi:ribosome recycling factor
MDETSLRSQMQKVLELVLSDIGTLRTGRASSLIVSEMTVAVYGGTQKLKIQEVANISLPDSQTIVIEPWDKSIIGEIRQGILANNVGLNPVINGQVIRISIPPLTLEDREKYVKLLGAKLESGRVMIRQARGEAMRDIRKAYEDKKMGEDEKFRQEKLLQEITDEFIEKIDSAGEKKKQEIVNI